MVTFVFHQCNLHIHGEHSCNNRMVPMVTLSDSTAVGLVIAHGNISPHLRDAAWAGLKPESVLSSAGTVGDSLSSSQHPDVFVSTDGGYNWRATLRGPHHYSILDSGGLMVAVEAHHEGQVKTIKYRTDWLILHEPTAELRRSS